MKQPLVQILSTVCLLVAAMSSHATPLPKSQVAWNAKWVMHLDVDRFAPSQTCRLLMNGHSGAKSFQTMLNRYRSLLGVDPMKDISGLTLYGTEVTGNRGTALISGALNHQAITRQLATYPGYATRSYGKLRLQTWTDKATGRALWACFYTTRLLILASDEASVLDAAAILDGSKGNLATGKGVVLPMQTVRDGSFFTAVTKGYAGPNPDPVKAMILRSTDTATLQIAENNGMVDGNILLQTISPDTAMQIHQVLNGLILSASLTDSSSPLAKLAGMSEISRRENDVSLKIHCPANDAAEILASSFTL